MIKCYQVNVVFYQLEWLAVANVVDDLVATTEKNQSHAKRNEDTSETTTKGAGNGIQLIVLNNNERISIWLLFKIVYNLKFIMRLYYSL